MNPQSDASTPRAAGTEPGATSARSVMIESAEARNTRLSTGALVLAAGLLLLWATLKTKGSARFALSDAFDAVRLPTVSLPGVATVLLCALVAVGAGLGFLSGRLSKRWRGWVGALAAVAVLMGFLAWGAAGRTLPFAVANQFAGALSFATPLIFGALCGVLCERSGVVNVAIEGQLLVGAFASAVAGSLTQSITVALLVGILAGVAMGALLALFSIKYLVNQVVLGVVINLFAAGLTGFLYDAWVKTDLAGLNNAPTMKKLPIPLLSDLPFFGPVLFRQTLLAYLAILSVVVVWFVLYRTKWGLRIRAVGEHPKAADTVGISVTAIRWSAVLFGGVFAGLGGAFFTIASTGSFSKEITVGNGFIALAAVIMGRWHPVWAALMALFFGFVTQLGSQLQTLQVPVPTELMKMLPYLATVVAVAGLVGRVRAPAADGTPYVKS